MELCRQFNCASKSPDVVFSICCIPSASSDLLAASGSRSIQLLAKDRLTSVGVIESKCDVRGIASSATDPNLLWSAGQDRAVRCWDVRAPKDAVRTMHTDSPNVGPFCCVASSGETSCVAVGTEQMKVSGEDTASVLLWDVRGAKPIANYDEAHSDTVTTVSFSPSHPKYLCSGSMDGLLSITDTTVTEVDDALETVLNSESSVSQAGYFGPSSEYAYCVTLMDAVLYWFVEEASLLGKHEDIRREVKESDDLLVNYIVDCFYQSDDAGQLTALAGSHSGDLHLLNVSIDGLHLSSTMPKCHTASVRSLHYDSTNRILYTGGEDGRVCCWSEGSSSTTQTASGRDEAATAAAPTSTKSDKAEAKTEESSSTQKVKRQPKRHEKFRPY